MYSEAANLVIKTKLADGKVCVPPSERLPGHTHACLSVVRASLAGLINQTCDATPNVTEAWPCALVLIRRRRVAAVAACAKRGRRRRRAANLPKRAHTARPFPPHTGVD